MRIAGLFLILGVIINSWAITDRQQINPLDIRLKAIPIDLKDVPLSKALEMIGISADNALVLFGTEITVKQGKEPSITVHIPAGVTIREALDRIVLEAPEYTFAVVAAHLINFFPKNASYDTRNLMNMHLSRLDLVDVAPSNFINHPERYIPELKAKLTQGVPQGCVIGPGLMDKAPSITLHLESSTLRDYFNFVSETSIALANDGKGSAFGWLYEYEESPSNVSPIHNWRVNGGWEQRKPRL